jgi:hypothetical protein
LTFCAGKVTFAALSCGGDCCALARHRPATAARAIADHSDSANPDTPLLLTYSLSSSFCISVLMSRVRMW